jgi:ubiquinone/menaquinone biosynthesis C-methylase UbiE
MRENQTTNEERRMVSERTFWEGFARDYDPFIKKLKRVYAKMYNEVARYLQPEMNVLEVGTGPGIVTLEIADKVKSVHACDISPAMIEIARQKQTAGSVNNVDFSVRDACNLGYEPESFDIAIISNVLHVLTEPERALRSIYTSLKDEGILLAPTYCHGQNGLSRTVSGIMSLRGFKASQKWSVENYRRFLQSCGFQILDEKRFSGLIPLIFSACEKRR